MKCYFCNTINKLKKMKKVFLIAAIAVFGFTTVNAQEEDKSFKEDVNNVVEMAKGGGFYVGANIGVPLSGAGDLASFNFGFDAAYLFEVIPNLEVGGLIGYTHFIGDGTYTYTGSVGGEVATIIIEDTITVD